MSRHEHHTVYCVHLLQVIELNLLLADWYDENHRQSLLYKANAKWAREMLYNTRCVTCFVVTLLSMVSSQPVHCII